MGAALNRVGEARLREHVAGLKASSIKTYSFAKLPSTHISCLPFCLCLQPITRHGRRVTLSIANHMAGHGA